MTSLNFALLHTSGLSVQQATRYRAIAFPAGSLDYEAFRIGDRLPKILHGIPDREMRARNPNFRHRGKLALLFVVITQETKADTTGQYARE